MRRVASITVIVALAGAAPALADDSPPGNLGNGLSRLVEPPAAKAGIRMTQAPLAIRDRQGRVLVDVYAEQGASLPAVRDRAEQAGLQTVTQADDALEGYVALDDVDALAKAAGVASVSQALKPFTNVGAATSQGVAAERVDRVPRGIDGRGITVGALSDSFDTATETVDGKPLTVHAADDIRTGDLPPEGVTVLEDDPTARRRRGPRDAPDRPRHRAEGPGVLRDGGHRRPRLREQHPRARRPERRLPRERRGRRRRLLRRAVLLARADQRRGRRRRRPGRALLLHRRQRLVASRPTRRRCGSCKTTAGSNINLAGVDPKLYAGGFEDFDPGPGTDIAQSMVLGGDPTSDDGGCDGILDLQWDDPVDPNGAPLGDPLIDTTGEITAAQPIAKIPFNGTAGQTIRAIVDAIPSGSTDFVLTLKDPAGNTLQEVDTGTSPETVVQTLPSTGTYTFEVSGFDGDLGDFTFKVQPVLGNSRTTTDLNALFFDAHGNFLFASQDLNRLSGKPFEIAGFHGKGALQLVIAKANTDAARPRSCATSSTTGWSPPSTSSRWRRASTATRWRAGRPRSPPTTRSGRSCPRTTRRSAAICRSTSTRPATGCRGPDIRRAPQVTATDGGNTTFFTVDSKLDPDTQPNFFGTSAAAPHAAAIAALVLQKHAATSSPDALRGAAGAQHVHPRPRRRPRRGLEPGPDDHRRRRAGRRAPRHAAGVDDAGLDERPALLHRRLHRPGHAHVAHARRPDRRRLARSTRGRSRGYPGARQPAVLAAGLPVHDRHPGRERPRAARRRAAGDLDQPARAASRSASTATRSSPPTASRSAATRPTSSARRSRSRPGSRSARGWSTRRARAPGGRSSARSATGSAPAGRRSTATAI